MKNGPKRERQFHRSPSSYARNAKRPYLYPEWVTARPFRSIPAIIVRELAVARGDRKRVHALRTTVGGAA